MENGKEEGRKSEPGEISAKERVDSGARERKTLKRNSTERQSWEQKRSFGANTGVKRETSTCVDFTGLEVKEWRNQGMERRKPKGQK